MQEGGHVIDEFQLTTIIAKAIRDCPVGGDGGEQAPMASEQATCVAKAVIGALAEAGLTVGPRVEPV